MGNKVSYDGLFGKLDVRNLSITAFGKKLGVSSATMAKIRRGEKVAWFVLERMASSLGSPLCSIAQELTDNPFIDSLLAERNRKIKNGFYHEIQISFCYNSNHIEGSRLTPEQTRSIYETDSVIHESPHEAVMLDDILEAVNHFRAFDRILDNIESPLSEDLIKDIHGILKRGTVDERKRGFAVSEYKKPPN